MLSSLNSIVRNMTEYFEPSPRATKRRRVSSRKAADPGLEGRDNIQEGSHTTSKAPEKQNEVQEPSEDSTYGSKEDSFVEEEGNAGRKQAKESNATHRRSREHSQAIQEQVQDTSVEAEDPSGTTIDSEDQLAEDTITVQPRSSGRERRRPRRFSLSPDTNESKGSVSATKPTKRELKSTSEQDTAPPDQATPKGILTPSRKGKRSGPRKSVLFTQSEKEIERQLGFKDIKDTVKKSPRTAVVSVETAYKEDSTSPRTPSKHSRSRPTASLIPDVEYDEDEEDIDGLPSNSIDPDVDLLDLDLNNSNINVNIVDKDPTMLALKTIVLERLVGIRSTSVPVHLQSQYDALYSLLRATIVSGESNSLLLLGARGTGKTHLVNSAISNLSLSHDNDFHIVRLNGFYQTDDRLALREIWRQLGREMQVAEMENGEVGGSYADTMNSLLSLLSHPDDFDIDIDVKDGDSTNMYRTSKSVIFILDEFDLFTTHPRQTLLYNLFDIAQSRKAPIAVVGCSTRADVVDCLEKRVKSRFSHRWLHIPSVKTLDGFIDIVRSVLCVEESDVKGNNLFLQGVQDRKRWNNHIESTFLQSSDIQDLIKHAFYTTKSIPDILSALYLPVAVLEISVSPGTSAVPVQDPAQHSLTEPSSLAVIRYLPTIQLSLLIAASRLDTIHNLTTVNFNLVYAHYVELISRSKLQITASGAVAVGAALRQWSREIAQSAWQELGSCECIVPVSGGASAGFKDNGSAVAENVGGEGASVRMWRVEVTLEELEWSIKQRWKESGGTRDVLVKWCKEI